MSYRAPGDRSDPVDAEAVAVAELGRRARRLRHAAHVPVLLLGLAVGVALYVVVREVSLTNLGVNIPWIVGPLTIGPVFVLAFRLAPRLGNALAARALPKWRAEMAQRHGLDEGALAEMTQFL